MELSYNLFLLRRIKLIYQHIYYLSLFFLNEIFLLGEIAYENGLLEKYYTD